MKNLLKNKEFLKDIRFWIILFFIIRLYGITMPPLEVGQNWRQTDGLMIARNFYERSANIIYPITDVAGEKSGIVGCEFPLLNYAIFVLSKIFGFENWYGRIINLVVSSVGIFFFYKLIRKYFGESHAFSAAIVMTVSLWFSYSRKTVPDTFAISFCLTSLFFALSYIEGGKWYELLLFFFLGSLGCLSKISSATTLSVLIIPVFFGSFSRRRKVLVSLLGALILIITYFWYFAWVPYLTTTYDFGPHFFMGMSFTESIKQLALNWLELIDRFTSSAMKYSGFLAFIISIYIVIKKRLWAALGVFSVPFLSCVVVMLKSGVNFTTNTYYVLIFIPSMAFIIGCGLTQLRKKSIITFALIVISIEGIADQIYDFRIRQPYAAIGDLEGIMDKISKRNDLVAINSVNPTPMFFAHRRGWTVPDDLLSNEDYINYLKQNNCKYIIILREYPWSDLILDFPKIFESKYFKVYSLSQGIK